MSAQRLFELAKISWDLPSVFSVLVFGEAPDWCEDWSKWRHPRFLEYKQAMLGETYGAVSLIVIGNINPSKKDDYVSMIRDIQVSLPNTHVAVPRHFHKLISQTATTLWYRRSESPWSVAFFEHNGFASAIEDGHLLKPSVVCKSLLARSAHIRSSLQLEYRALRWQCKEGLGMYHKLKLALDQPAEPAQIALRVNSTSDVVLSNKFSQNSTSTPHYTLNVVRLSDLVAFLQDKSRETNTSDEYYLMDEHVFKGSDNRGIVNVLVLDDTRDVQRTLDYTQACIMYRWYVLHEAVLGRELETLLVRHIVSLEKFPTPVK